MRLIDAQAYCKELILERDYPNRSEEFKSAIEVAIADLGDMPTIEAEPVKHGRWVEKEDAVMHCTECDRIGNPRIDNYCSRCGARMDGDLNG